MLAPWLGASAADPDLPLPAMIDVDLTPSARADLASLRAAVTAVAPAARIDDSAATLAPLANLIESLRWLAAGLVLLMLVATGAIVALAARAALDTHRETIEVLHLMGGTDAQVARLFQRRIALDTLFGGLVGLAAAMLVMIAIGNRVSDLGSDLLGGAALPLSSWLILMLLPLAGTALAMAVARAHDFAGIGAAVMIGRAFSFLLLVYVLGYALFVVMLPRPADAQRTDAIVVLTGGAKRIERGLDLLERDRAQRMLISGVDRTVRPAELAVQYPGSGKWFGCCVDLGRESVDTRSNAEETARWLKRHKFKSVRLVTTDWHMPRARFELAMQLDETVVVIGDAVQSKPSFTQLFTEYNKYLLRHAAVLVGI